MASRDHHPGAQGAESDVITTGGASPGRLKKRGASPQYYQPPLPSDIPESGPTPSHSNTSSYSAAFSTDRASSTANDPANTQHRNCLTVTGQWKVDREQSKGEWDKKGGVVALALVKWLVTILMSLALLVCLVSAKMAVLVLGKQLNTAASRLNVTGGEALAWSQYTAQFVVLYVLLTVPSVLNATRAVWYGLLDSTVPWPSRRAIILSVLRAALESVGLCLMVYKVLGYYDSPLSILLLATPLFLPAIDSLLHVLRGRGERPGVVVVMVTGIGVCGAAGVLTVVLLVKRTSAGEVWGAVVAVACLSLAWLPALQQRISATKHDAAGANSTGNGVRTDAHLYGTFNRVSVNTTLSERDSGVVTQTFGDETGNGLTTATQNGHSTAASDDEPPASTMTARSGTTWKTAFVVHACRVGFTFLTSALLFMLDSPGGPAAVFTDTVHDAFLNGWNLASHVSGESTWHALGVGLGAGLLGYALAFAACHMNMMRGALAPPLILATPLSVLMVSVTPMCRVLLGEADGTCSWQEGGGGVWLVVGGAVCFFLAPLLTFGYRLWCSVPDLLQQESVVFWLPGYNAPALDTWLLLNRRADVTSTLTTAGQRQHNKVYICTTMYREEESEMRQLLESIHEINEARAAGDCQFESHIILDGGVRQRELSQFSLTLIGLLEDTLGIRPEVCTKTETPYGLKLSWLLPGPGPRPHQMPFSIHLKDNRLVKNKKRWSQVMYMSYVLDFLTQDSDADSYILTTDADVVFTPDSVEALLDLMTRDHSIGAVCARTHPMGDGPLVWYQKFEYAIGHWFQKTAEHVLGSVLCAPGCFSVYRCRALADVLPKYARRVESAFDFLTKDMGEDRWLCTLMVQSGWRIEYCATSENSTNCPSHFDEFYKQRRRWIASTLANLMLIVREWKYVRQLNHRVSTFFLIYQVLLLCSTLIGPSTIVLVVSGGMLFAWGTNSVLTVLLQLVLCVLFAMMCIYASQHMQLTAAKIYTFLYAVAMTAVSVGTAIEIVKDIQANSTQASTTPSTNGSEPLPPTTTPAPNQHISNDLPVSLTTLYFGGLAGIFLLAAILHPREFTCLVHGLWYLLCLPSGYLVLTIYSVCNITDSSWGTREEQEDVHVVPTAPWYQRLNVLLQHICFCCARRGPAASINTRDSEAQTASTTPLPDPNRDDTPPSPQGRADVSTREDDQATHELYPELAERAVPLPVEEWLPPGMVREYAARFKRHGFDSTVFIAGMTEKELLRIGVTSKGHRSYLLAQVALIPTFDVECKVPTNVDDWLTEIGLPEYKSNFRRNHIQSPKEMEILKSFGRKEIENELGIKTDGHIKRLRYAISRLRDPTEGQRTMMRMRQVIEDVPMNYLHESNVGEHDFWLKLRRFCLEPDLKAFGLESEVKAKLAGLRNDWLMILAVSNTLWLILITTLAASSDLLLLNANPLGVVFLIVFGVLFVVQFLAMLMHRMATVAHFVARAPYRCGRPMHTAWSFSTGFEDTVDRDALLQLKRDTQRAWSRVFNRSRRPERDVRSPDDTSETTPLVV